MSHVLSISTKRVLVFLLCAGFIAGLAPLVQGQVVSYPLKVSANGRYLVDQSNQPFMLVGDSPQGLIPDLSLSEAATYFANRASFGFNAVQIHLIAGEFFGGRSNFSTFDGITPFTTPGDISTPRDSYFARVDAILNLASQHGIVVFLTAAETIESLNLFRSNGALKARTFGQYLGSRYRNFDNIVWVYGNDFQTWTDPSDNAVILAVANGIKDMDSRHLHTAWLNYFLSASRDSPDWAAVSDIDFVYTYSPTYAKTLQEYALSPAKPVFLGEANYEEESISVPLTTPEIVRRQQYWVMTSGATGSFYGNAWTWRFAPGWQSNYSSPGAAQMVHFKALFTSRAWWNLVPDTSHLVLTGGFGTYDASGSIAFNDYATAAMTTDSTLMIAYLPSIRTVSVNMSRFAGTVTARWFDPSNGVYSTIAGSPFANSGSRNFGPPGSNAEGKGDWVLVMESSATDTTPPSISGVTVSGITTSSAVVSWTTDEPASTQVEYGPTPSYGLITTLDPSLVTSHVASLPGLMPNTTYHYRVRSRDAAGNLAVSGNATFGTEAIPDTTPPSISGVAVSSITASSAAVSWTTNEASDTQVEYGLTTSYGLTTTLNTSLVTSHVATLAGLSASTTYHYRARSKDAAGNLAVSANGTFSTGAAGSFSAQFLGVAEDRVGPGNQPTPNGIPDWRIHVQGLRSTPTKVRITSTAGGAWEAPFNGANWTIATQYGAGGVGDFWFEQWGSPGFHVKVFYSDGTTDEADATTSGAPPPVTFAATFVGATQDRVGSGSQLSPNGIPDWQIHVEGLRSTPTKVRITSTAGGIWEMPFNGANWVIATQYGAGGIGDFFFEAWGTPGFHVKVFYSDGTTDEADAGSPGTPSPPPPPPVLAAVFLGVGQDRVGSGTQLTPNGIPDWQIRLTGLLSTPIRIRVTSAAGGIWEMPFNGANWVMATQFGGGGTGDVWFEPYSTSGGFHVQVWYSDGTTAQDDASSVLGN